MSNWFWKLFRKKTKKTTKITFKFHNDIELFCIIEKHKMVFSKRMLPEKIYSEIKRCFYVDNFKQIKIIGDCSSIYNQQDIFIDGKLNIRKDFLWFLVAGRCCRIVTGKQIGRAHV